MSVHLQSKGRGLRGEEIWEHIKGSMEFEVEYEAAAGVAALG
jgi:hypothetical protein